MRMSNRCYDILKTIAQVVIPAIATIYWVLAEFVGILPYGEAVVGALVAIDTCLGSILAYSSYEYEEGDTFNEADTGIVGNLKDEEDNE